MKKISIAILTLVFGLLNASAQVGVGVTGSVDASAKLQVDATNKGFLAPRVELTATNLAAPVTSPATGLLVFNTATAGSGATAVTPGFYYYSGSAWVRLIVPTDNAANVTGTVAITNGGTGQTTANDALNALLPSQSGNANKILKTDGTTTSWATNVALTSAVKGVLSTAVGNVAANTWTGSTITLPPGKWSIQVTMFTNPINTVLASDRKNVWVNASFSTSSSSFVEIDNAYKDGSTVVSGLCTVYNYNMITGTVIINNTSGSDLTLYFWSRSIVKFDPEAPDPDVVLANFGRTQFAQNAIVAYPMN